jgi:glutamate formiminotransferase / formiminotetrahydrofolate cyclodeaminase
MRLVECVPNFSEGRNEKVINAIADSIKAVNGVKLLDVDPGYSTNRTVVTFVGEPESVVEAAFQAIATASKLIDMRKHSGEHPRMGATDVCPFVPVSGISMEECAALSETLAKKVGEELKIPVYLYANAAKRPDRESLADIRKGEYEALPTKMKDDSFIPDYGPREFNATAGVTVIGARPFLLAYNVNLNTKSKKLANEIALNIREAGRAKKDSDGKAVKDAAGNAVKVPGILKACRAVGWYVDEYERAQVSINLIDHKVTSLHHAFDASCEEAEKLGLRVTGSEVVGMIPLEPMLEAGKHYLRKQGRSTGVSESELVTIAIQSLGLSDLVPFERNSKIIEYKVRSDAKLLTDRTVTGLIDELASESPAPGGGSVSALCGALSAGLSSMVANLTFEKKGFEKQKSLMDATANKAQRLKEFFVKAIDDDTAAFNQIVNARRMPKNSADEIQRREEALFQANVRAIEVPMSILLSSEELLKLAEIVLRDGNQNSLSDAGCAVLNAVAAGEGAYMNVLINLAGLSRDGREGEFRKKLLDESERAIARLRKTASVLTDDTFAKLKAGLKDSSGVLA